MGLEVRKPEGQNFVVVEEKLWLTTDDRLVPDGHRDAAILFATPGKRVDLATAVRYGLVDAPKAKAKQVDAPENKAVEAPAEDKSVVGDAIDGEREEVPGDTIEGDGSGDPLPPVDEPVPEPAKAPAKRAKKASKAAEPENEGG